MSNIIFPDPSDRDRYRALGTISQSLSRMSAERAKAAATASRKQLTCVGCRAYNMCGNHATAECKRLSAEGRCQLQVNRDVIVGNQMLEAVKWLTIAGIEGHHITQALEAIRPSAMLDRGYTELIDG